jgi:hypothetical protein
VDFYSSEKSLVGSILDYITIGLDNGDSCIMFAKPQHIQLLDREISKQSSGLKKQFLNDCRLFNAESVLSQFMLGGIPDNKKFFEVMTTLLVEVKQKDKPIRAFGEMVAILLEEENPNGAIQLEKLWNEFASVHSFSLYCAYPDDSQDLSRNDFKSLVKSSHDLSFSSRVTA